MASCNSQNNEVYMSLMYQRTQNDQSNIKQYNCVNFTRTITPSIVAMLAPSAQASFMATKTVNPSVMYMLAPTPESVNKTMASSMSVDKNDTYPPSCGYNSMPENICRNSTPSAYPGLNLAYDPTTGSRCVNAGQNLNMQYTDKK